MVIMSTIGRISSTDFLGLTSNRIAGDKRTLAVKRCCKVGQYGGQILCDDAADLCTSIRDVLDASQTRRVIRPLSCRKLRLRRRLRVKLQWQILNYCSILYCGQPADPFLSRRLSRISLNSTCIPGSCTCKPMAPQVNRPSALSVNSEAILLLM